MILVFLIGAFGLGRFIINSLGLTWHRIEAWALIILFGYFFGAWTLLLTCASFGFMAGTAVSFTLMLGSWILPQARRSPDRFSLPTSRQTEAWFITTGALSVIICYILYRQMLESGPGGAYSGGGVSADMPVHLSIITNVAYATHFTWHFSLLTGAYLTYPFLVDFLSGMIVRWGGSLRLSLLLTSIPLCLSLTQILFFLGYRAFKNVRSAAFFTTLFLLDGSNFGFIPALIDCFHFKSHLWGVFSNPPHDYSDTAFYHFGNFVITILMPQRGFQFGVSIFCAVMLLIYQLRTAMDVAQRRRILLLIGILTGLLPLAHVHSFFMSFTVLMTLALLDHKTARIQEWLVAIAVSLVIALPQIVFQLRANHHVSFVHFEPGWMYYVVDFPGFSHYTGIFLHILANFGIVLVLVIFSYRCLKGNDLVRRLVFLGIAIFIASNLFVFQPVNYDNIKFLIYAYLFFCLAVSQYLAQLSRTGKWQWAFLTLLLVFPGVSSVVWQIRDHNIIYSDKALSEARELRRQLPSDALVLTSAYDEHPLWGLAGQPVVAGGTGWLASYGLPVEQVSRDVRSIYEGEDDALPLLRRYGVQYVLISRYERIGSPIVNEPFFERHFPLVYQHDGVSIYQVRRAS